MDDDLRAYIEAAVGNYLADNGGGMVTAWHFVADMIDGDGDQSWLYATADQQTQITTMGLVEWARGISQFEQHAHLCDVSETDED